LSIEQGDDSGAPLELTTDAIAEKFVQYYWRQVVPYATPGEATILQQNTDRQAAIVNLVREARASYGGSLTAAMRDLAGWRRLVRKVARVVREMPLWRLHRIGAEQWATGCVGNPQTLAHRFAKRAPSRARRQQR
jgi:hypothetical protein